MRNEGTLGWLHSVARSHVEVALKHPIKLIANALGSPPKDVIDQSHAAGVAVAALAGSAKHARRHVDNGVDIVIAQGHEAGGHTGEIGSVVLWPEIVDALGDAPVLAAGGIGDGRQVAAALALGAARRVDGLGVAHLRRVRPRVRPDRWPVRHPGGLLRRPPATPCAAASTRQAGPAAQEPVDRRLGCGGCTEPLPMPLQNVLVGRGPPADERPADPGTVAMPVGQIVGRMNEIRPVADIIAELVSGFEAATGGLDDIRESSQ